MISFIIINHKWYKYCIYANISKKLIIITVKINDSNAISQQKNKSLMVAILAKLMIHHVYTLRLAETNDIGYFLIVMRK